MDQRCMKRVATGATVGGSLGAAVGMSTLTNEGMKEENGAGVFGKLAF